MAEIATVFLSPFLQAFFEKVASREFVDFFRRRKLDDGLLKKMKIALLSVMSARRCGGKASQKSYSENMA
ncbi:hypothetical protein CJ030_MR6G000520 [Morella rubra]|uniref:Uncharacterized protein n=1 Tax=Morella rubra TaxID=262757 RepID=A0A6A1V8G2_9ROSI|nr:hypothetical protein CJ030_MR6G000520 [Morella rubra]